MFLPLVATGSFTPILTLDVLVFVDKGSLKEESSYALCVLKNAKEGIIL